MEAAQQKPYRLAGICKRCHEFRFGFILYGLGPFICQECAKEIRTSHNQTTGETRSYWFSSNTTWKQNSG